MDDIKLCTVCRNDEFAEGRCRQCGAIKAQDIGPPPSEDLDEKKQAEMQRVYIEKRTKAAEEFSIMQMKEHSRTQFISETAMRFAQGHHVEMLDTQEAYDKAFKQAEKLWKARERFFDADTGRIKAAHTAILKKYGLDRLDDELENYRDDGLGVKLH